MMTTLLSMFGIHRAGMVLSIASNVIKAFEQEFAHDHNAKAAALGALVEVLNQQKQAYESIPVPKAPVPEAQSAAPAV
jgi:hypothetical protein